MSHGINDFRRMFVEECDFERLGVVFELFRPNRYAITLDDSKVGRVVTWGCANPNTNSPICPIKTLMKCLLIRDRLGEVWSPESPLFTIIHDANKYAQSAMTKIGFEVLLSLYADKFGVNNIAVHSVRKYIITSSASAGIPQGVCKNVG